MLIWIDARLFRVKVYKKIGAWSLYVLFLESQLLKNLIQVEQCLRNRFLLFLVFLLFSEAVTGGVL